MHPRRRAAVQQALQVALEADLRVERRGAGGEVGAGTRARRSAGSTRADARSASAREHPIVAVIHGISDVVLERRRPGGRGSRRRRWSPTTCPTRTACRASCVKAAKSSALQRRRERMHRREDRRAARRREDAQAAGRLQRLAGAGIRGVVQAELLQERDVDGVRVGMEELRAEIDRDGLPAVGDRPRVAVPADPRPRLEEVDVERARQEVGRGHAPRPGADDRHPVAPAAPAGGGRGAGHQRRAGGERHETGRALEDVATGDRGRGHGAQRRRSEDFRAADLVASARSGRRPLCKSQPGPAAPAPAPRRRISVAPCR